jgi:hypothetical protein
VEKLAVSARHLSRRQWNGWGQFRRRRHAISRSLCETDDPCLLAPVIAWGITAMRRRCSAPPQCAITGHSWTAERTLSYQGKAGDSATNRRLGPRKMRIGQCENRWTLIQRQSVQRLLGSVSPRNGSRRYARGPAGENANVLGSEAGPAPGLVDDWLRRWSERDDRHLVKRAGPSASLDPLEELIRVVNEAQERDAEDERRLHHSMRGDRPSFFQRRRPHRR